MLKLLSQEEMDLYDKVYEHVNWMPLLRFSYIFQAPIETLKERISKSNIHEQYLTLDYLERLNDAYSKFFYIKDAPLLSN